MASGAADTAETLRGTHQGAGWFLTWIDGLEVVYMDRRMTRRSLSVYLDVIEHLIRTATAPRGVLYEVREPSVLDAPARRRLSAMLSQYEETLRRNTLGYALVTPSATVRGILSTLYWMAPPPYPNRVFGELGPAFDWLATKAPLLNPALTCSRYEGTKLRLLTRLDGSEEK